MRGQVEHVLTMTNLKLKPSLFTPRPSVDDDDDDDDSGDDLMTYDDCDDDDDDD